MNLLKLPADILLYVTQLLDFKSKQNLRLCCSYCRDFVDQPSNWKTTVSLPKVHLCNKKFWHLLRTRNITRLSVYNVKNLTHYDVMFRYLKSLVHLETECSLLHTSRSKMEALNVGNIQSLSLSCVQSLVPCEDCSYDNLVFFTSVKSLALRSVTSAYLKNMAMHFQDKKYPPLEVLKVCGWESSQLMLTDLFGRFIGFLENLKELYISDNCRFTEFLYYIITKGENFPRLTSLQLLGHVDVDYLTEIFENLAPSLKTLFVCIDVSEAKELMDALGMLPNLTSLGIEFEGFPCPPDGYCLQRIPNHLESLSLAFTIKISSHLATYCKMLMFYSHEFPDSLIGSLNTTLRQRLKYLWIATIELTNAEIKLIEQDFTNLETLVCRLKNPVSFPKLQGLIHLPKLRNFYVHGTPRNISHYQQDLTDRKLLFHSTVYPVFDLPSFQLQDGSTSASLSQRQPVPTSVFFGHSRSSSVMP